MRRAIPPAPGLSIETSRDGVIITVEREAISPFLSVLLNSKFGTRPRGDFLLNPHVNGLIEACLDADPRIRARFERARKDGNQPDLSEAEQEVRRSAAHSSIGEDELAELIDLALYPWA